nr:MAG TPA: hypothetical protein [Caudoviricetes sp.]
MLHLFCPGIAAKTAKSARALYQEILFTSNSEKSISSILSCDTIEQLSLESALYREYRTSRYKSVKFRRIPTKNPRNKA